MWFVGAIIVIVSLFAIALFMARGSNVARMERDRLEMMRSAREYDDEESR